MCINRHELLLPQSECFMRALHSRWPNWRHLSRWIEKQLPPLFLGKKGLSRLLSFSSMKAVQFQWSCNCCRRTLSLIRADFNRSCDKEWELRSEVKLYPLKVKIWDFCGRRRNKNLTVNSLNARTILTEAKYSLDKWKATGERLNFLSPVSAAFTNGKFWIHANTLDTNREITSKQSMTKCDQWRARQG